MKILLNPMLESNQLTHGTVKWILLEPKKEHCDGMALNCEEAPLDVDIKMADGLCWSIICLCFSTNQYLLIKNMIISAFRYFQSKKL